jgi:hypothetical protein
MNVIHLPIGKDVKHKFSPTKKTLNNFNHAYVNEFVCGLLSLDALLSIEYSRRIFI